MGEPENITFEYKEIVQALVKHQGIHEGIWGLTIQFGLQVSNIKVGEKELVPGLIIPLVKMGIQKLDKVTPLSVDAAKVNPLPKP
jgi:hypothetical protein